MSLFNEAECSFCGKTFTMSDPTQWVYRLKYKDRQLSYCSWGCMQKAKRGEKPTKKKK